MVGPLGVSHLFLFSRSNTGNTNLRLALTPRGPTLHFRVDTYSLSKDIQKAVRHAKSSRQEYLTPPLLVMNNFMSPLSEDTSEPAVPKHLENLTTTVFQSIFPPISPQSTPLSSIRRVLLLNRELPKPSSNGSSVDTGSYTINLRHYAITTKRLGLSKAVRRLNPSKHGTKRRGFVNLSRLEDAADYVLDPSAAGGGFTSGSESELETDAEVEVVENSARKVLSRKQVDALRSKNEKVGRPGKLDVEKKGVKLVEIGPRIKLRMTKVEEGVCGGKIMWHEFVNKTSEEVQQMERLWDVRRKEKQERRRVQKENVERKRNNKSESQIDEAREQSGELSDDYDWDEEVSQDSAVESETQEGGVSMQTRQEVFSGTGG